MAFVSCCFRSARAKNDNFEEGLLKLVRTLPKVLKFLPSDKAQDARNFVQGLQYWLGGNSENLQVCGHTQQLHNSGGRGACCCGMRGL